MADEFNIDAKLVIAGVEVKGDLNAGKLKFDIDTSALKKLVQDAGTAAQNVKTKIDGVEFNKIKLELNQTSLRSMKSQIRKTIQDAVSEVKFGQVGGAVQKGAAGKLSRVSRGAAQIVQQTETPRKGGFRDPVTGRFQKAADAISHSAEALKIVLQKAGASIRPNVAAKAQTQAQLNKSNKRRLKDTSRLDEIRQEAAADKAGSAQRRQQSQLETQKRLMQISQEATAERAANEATHRKRVTQSEKEHQKALANLQKRLAAERKAGVGSQNQGSLNLPKGARSGNVGDILGGSGGGGGGGGGRGPGPGASPGGPGRGAGGINEAAAALGAMTGATQKANKEMESLEDLTFLVGKKAAAFRGVAIAINTIVTASQAALKFVIDFSDSLKEVNKILQLSDSSLQKLGDDLLGLAAKTGVAVDQTIGISEQFARAGLTGRGYGSVVDLTSRALTGMQGTTMDAAQATELFIQIIQQVEGGARGLNKELVTTTKLFDVLGKAEDITASKATDVQQAFKRSAASVLATGTSIEQATTLISVLQERTQRGGDVIGTALKTMAARISSSSSDATKALNSIGVATIDAQGNLRNLFDVLEDTSIAFQHLSEAEQADISVKAAGIRQVEIFRSAVRDFGRMQTVNTKLTEAEGDAARKQAAEQSKLVNVISRLQIAFQKMVKTASDGILGKVFVFAVTAIEKAATAVANFDKMFGGALSTVLGFGAAVIGFKVLIPMLVGIGRAIHFFMGAQKQVAQEMGVIQKESAAVGTTIEGKMVSSINRSAEATTRLRMEMEGVANASARAAQSTQGMAGGPGFFGGGGPGARGNQQAGGAIVQPGATILTPAQQKAQSKLGKVRAGATKQVGKFAKGLKGLATNVSTLSIATAVLGGVMQTAADNIRDAGHDKTATGVEALGGALQGAGTGALIGSLIAGPVGTAVGAALGGIAGAMPALAGSFDDTSRKTRELTAELTRLGIIQSKNGEITSEAAQKIEEAMRNIEAISTIEIGFKRRQAIAAKDSKSAREQASEEKTLVAQLAKKFETSVGAQKSDDANLQAIFGLTSELVKLRSGKDTNLASAITKGKSGIAGENITAGGLKIMQQAIVDLGKASGFETDELAVKLENIFRTRERKDPAEKRAEKQRITDQKNAFKAQVDQIVPKATSFGAFTGGLSIELPGINDFNDALKELVEGETDKADPRFDVGIKTAIERGFLSKFGADVEKTSGEEGRVTFESLIEEADKLRAAFKAIEGSGLQNAFFQTKQAAQEFLASAKAFRDTNKQIANIAKRGERTRTAFTDIDKIGDSEVNELKVAFRTFIQDFGREVLKLNESRIRATTPQVELASALAMNAHDVLKAAEKNAKVQLDTSRLTAQQTLSEIGNEGKFLSSQPNAIRAAFPELRKGGVENADAIEKRIKAEGGKGADVQKTLDALLRGGDTDKLGKIFFGDKFKTNAEREDAAKARGGFDPAEDDAQDALRARVKEIQKFATTTVGSALDTFFAEGQKLINDSIKRGVDPTEGLKGLADTTKGFGKIPLEQQKEALKALQDHAKRSVSIEKDALDKRLKFNQLSVAAIRARITEDKRLLSADKSRRDALAMNERAMAQELTGMRRLVAERQIAHKLLSAEISAEQERADTISTAITAITPKTKSDDAKERTTALNQLRVLEIEFNNTQTNLIKKRGQLQVNTARDALRAVKLAADAGKQAAGAERTRIGAMSEISGLLSMDQSQMQGFNAELKTLSDNFKVSQAEVAAQAQAASRIKDPGAREDALREARQAGLKVAFDMARAEAQIEAKRRQAIKQVTGKLLSNQQDQVNAQKKVIDATKALSDTYETYLQAVDGAILATTRYNLEISLADVQARKTTGGFTGIRDQLSAVQAAFRDAERMAAEMGASEKTLVNIRRESISQQLDLFNELLSQQTSAARSFFTSSAEDQAKLAQGIQEAKGLADLFGGSFDAFKGKARDEGALNDLGAKILSLPQDMRQRIAEALNTLKTTGGTIGGFTADELQTAIDSATFGESAELKTDPLFEVQQRIADLQREQAQIATEQLVTANEQVQNAKEQLELAQAAKDLAEIQLERVKEEGSKLRAKLGELRGGLNTTLLQQMQNTTKGFQSVTSAVGRAADRMISTLPGAFNAAVGKAIDAKLNLAREGGLTIPESESNQTPLSRSKELADDRKLSGRDQAAAAGAAGQAGVGSSQPPAPQVTTSNNPNDPNTRTFSSMLTELKDISKNIAANLVVTQEIKDGQNNTVGTAAATVTGEQTEITVNVAGTSTVTVTGFEAGVTRIASALTETFGGFATEEEALRIANEVLENIRTELLRRGIITPTTR